MRAHLRALLAACALSAALPALAHKPSDAYLSLQAQDGHVSGQWDIALRDLDHALVLDADGDGALTWDEVRRRHADIAAYALGRLALSDEAGPCQLLPQAQLVDRHADGAYSVLRFDAACPGRAARLDVEYRLFADLDPQHRGLLRVGSGTQAIAVVLGPGAPRQSIVLGRPQRGEQALGFVRNGVWHIWTGLDHVLFLLSLLLPAVLATPGMPAVAALRAAAGDVVRVVTAFTLAHSLTLSLAATGMVEAPARWVESLIAASVALAALNNLVPLFPRRRPLVAFGFGLVHGFGFASVLGEAGLVHGALALPLFAFNAGVELGQLAIVAAFLPAAFALRGTQVYQRTVTAASVLIVVLGLAWLAERAFGLRLLPT